MSAAFYSASANLSRTSEAQTRLNELRIVLKKGRRKFNGIRLHVIPHHTILMQIAPGTTILELKAAVSGGMNDRTRRTIVVDPVWDSDPHFSAILELSCGALFNTHRPGRAWCCGFSIGRTH